MSIQPFNLCINRINLKSFATLTQVTCHKKTYIYFTKNWLRNLACSCFLIFFFANKPYHHHHHHFFPLGTLVALVWSCLNIWSSTRISSFLFIIVHLICNMPIPNIRSSLFKIVLGILQSNITCFYNSELSRWQMCPMYLSCCVSHVSFDSL